MKVAGSTMEVDDALIICECVEDATLSGTCIGFFQMRVPRHYQQHHKLQCIACETQSLETGRVGETVKYRGEIRRLGRGGVVGKNSPYSG